VVEQNKKPSRAEVYDPIDRAWRAMGKDDLERYDSLSPEELKGLASGERKPKPDEENIAAYLQAVKAYTDREFSLNGEESAKDR